jgi:hypothetical protein
MTSTLTSPKTTTRLPSRSWKTGVLLGGLTAILGVLVLLDPGRSLVLVAMLAGAELLVSGAYHLIPDASGTTSDKLLRAVVGAAAIIAGIVFLTHLAVTLLVISVVVGALWLGLGFAEVASAIGSRGHGGVAWSLLCGVLGMLAGLVVLAWPLSSLLALTLLLGIWLIVRGVTRMVAGFAERRPR